MTSLLSRVAEHFIAPRPPGLAEPHIAHVDDRVTHAGPLPPARALVLGGGATAPPVAAALAGELRRSAGSGAAVVCTWSAGTAPPAATGAGRGGSAAARRLAARLVAREIGAVARGRLVWVALPAGPEEAMTAIARASAAVDAPLVLAVAGARPAAFDALLDDLDLIVVTPSPKTPPAATALALADLEHARAPVVVRPPLARATGRRLALAGHGRLPKDELRTAARALA